MRGYDLPSEADLSLSMGAAVGYLERLVGEEVVVWIDLAGGADQLMSAGRLRGSMRRRRTPSRSGPPS